MQRGLIVLVLNALSGLLVMSCTKEKPPEKVATSAGPLVFKDVGLRTPESVLYDAEADEYVVSNIDGEPLKADANGFVSRLTPDGKVAKLKWIDKLDAPKGMALARDNLYVGDIDKVRIFDRKTGAPKGEVKIPGGTFVNDLAVGADGRVLVSDTGTTGNDAVYAIEKDDKTVTTVAKSKELGGPNGLLSTADKTWVATFKSGELYSLDAKGTRGDVQKLPQGSLDGIVALPNGDVLVSSWEANGVFRGKPGGAFTLVIEGVKAPADIGFDSKRSRVLIPLFNDNEVRAYDVK
jgi:hypothetical protein